MLKKFSVAVLVIVFPIILTATAANAVLGGARSGAKPCEHLGFCAPGTCSKDGTARACNIKNCSKKNCR
jgi:hypothetical protein